MSATSRCIARIRSPRDPANRGAREGAWHGVYRARIRARRTAVVLSLNLYDAVLDAMETPQEDPDLGRARREINLINAHPECLAEILVEYPYLQSRYEEYRMLLDDADMIDRPRVQMEVMRHAEETYKAEHRRGNEALAAAATCEVHSQSGDDRRAADGRRVRLCRLRRAVLSTITTDGRFGSRRTAIPRSAPTRISRR